MFREIRGTLKADDFEGDGGKLTNIRVRRPALVGQVATYNAPDGELGGEVLVRPDQGGTGANFSSVPPGEHVLTVSGGIFSADNLGSADPIPGTYAKRDAWGNLKVNSLTANTVYATTVGQALEDLAVVGKSELNGPVYLSAGSNQTLDPKHYFRQGIYGATTTGTASVILATPSQYVGAGPGTSWAASIRAFVTGWAASGPMLTCTFLVHIHSDVAGNLAITPCYDQITASDDGDRVWGALIDPQTANILARGSGVKNVQWQLFVEANVILA